MHIQEKLFFFPGRSGNYFRRSSKKNCLLKMWKKKNENIKIYSSKKKNHIFLSFIWIIFSNLQNDFKTKVVYLIRVYESKRNSQEKKRKKTAKEHWNFKLNFQFPKWVQHKNFLLESEPWRSRTWSWRANWTSSSRSSLQAALDPQPRHRPLPMRGSGGPTEGSAFRQSPRIWRILPSWPVNRFLSLKRMTGKENLTYALLKYSYSFYIFWVSSYWNNKYFFAIFCDWLQSDLET